MLCSLLPRVGTCFAIQTKGAFLGRCRTSAGICYCHWKALKKRLFYLPCFPFSLTNERSPYPFVYAYHCIIPNLFAHLGGLCLFFSSPFSKGRRAFDDNYPESAIVSCECSFSGSVNTLFFSGAPSFREWSLHSVSCLLFSPYSNLFVRICFLHDAHALIRCRLLTLSMIPADFLAARLGHNRGVLSPK